MGNTSGVAIMPVNMWIGAAVLALIGYGLSRSNISILKWIAYIMWAVLALIISGVLFLGATGSP